MPGRLKCVFDPYDHRFHNYHVLMSKRVREILLVAGPFDACLLNRAGRLEEAVRRQYDDLALSGAPRVTWAASVREAIDLLGRRDFDLLFALPQLPDGDAWQLGLDVRARLPEMPVVLLTPREEMPRELRDADRRRRAVDRVFTWTGLDDGWFAFIKCVEDRLNADFDTALGGVQVIVAADGSPGRLARLLPALYREIVDQTRSVIEEGFNESDRLLRRRTRPKILVADSLEEAEALVERFGPHLLGVIAGRDLPRDGGPGTDAGGELLEGVRERYPCAALLLTAPGTAAVGGGAGGLPLLAGDSRAKAANLSQFVREHMGFGDFTFRLPDGTEVARVDRSDALATILEEVPDASILHHCTRHDFSRWLRARGEFALAERLRRFTAEDFDNDPVALRRFLVEALQQQRRERQTAMVDDFDPARFDLERGLAKIGQGSLGGKARGLVFLKRQLASCPELHAEFAGLQVYVPSTLVLTTEVFDAFLAQNHLSIYSRTTLTDEEIAALFTRARMPAEVTAALRSFLQRADFPLAVRSSSLLEDSLTKPYAGIYRTVMVPNRDPDPEVRLAQLLEAIQLVYASTFFEDPRAFARRTGHKPDEEKMAVVIQRLVGRPQGELFFPAISGVAQSYNHYPMAPMRPEDGIAIVALGLGKTVVDGERSLRFCPAYPDKLPQFSTVDDILANAQRFFYGLRLDAGRDLGLGAHRDGTLVKQEVADFQDPQALRHVVSTYLPADHRIKDGFSPGGQPLVTFAPVLKHARIPLARLLQEVLAMGEEGMGGAVDIEFSAVLPDPGPPAVAILQIRPMSARTSMARVEIDADDRRRAFCYSASALGNGASRDPADVLFVRPEDFDPAATPQIARELGRLNAELVRDGRRYILIGPGRWGSADPWLGIPVKWADISGTSVIVETTHPSFRAEPSQGSHFFHNIASLGMGYLTIREGTEDFLDWSWLQSQPVHKVTRFLSLVRVETPLVVKVDGRRSTGVIGPG